MKQILQNLRTGETLLVDVPCPRVQAGHLLIRSRYSLLSIGTEKMLINFSKANLLNKARQQPDKVKMVQNKIKTDGLFSAAQAIRSKLDQPLPLGYCNVGVVVEVGVGVSNYEVGNHVVSNGSHAEMVCVPANLCAKIPINVNFKEATFTVIGAIALQGIRLAQPSLGEVFVVAGLGSIGLMSVQLLVANGCRVLGIDFDIERLKLAKQFGAEIVNFSKREDAVSAALAFSRGRGVDGVIITASTKSNEPVHQAALMCRKRGRIVLIGMVGLKLSRADFYEKELTFQVSCSYGPGRYDPEYELKGQDYPIGFVRWTAQRNFEAVLDMLANRHIDVESLISYQYSFEQAIEAYRQLNQGGHSLGILLQYKNEKQKPSDILRAQTVRFTSRTSHPRIHTQQIVVGFIGAGNYATQVLIPAFKKMGVVLKTVACNNGVSGLHASQKFGFQEITTDIASLLADNEINTVAIATRHDSHARFVCQALKEGKNVFVEKPLALNRTGLANIESIYKSIQTSRASPILMVGFNRRFAPQIQKMKELLDGIKEPKSLIMTVNAGFIPTEHWTQDLNIGGGRIIGEGCHFIDLLRFLVNSAIISVQVVSLGDGLNNIVSEDKVTFMLKFADGSFGTVHYLANGHKSFPKERLDVFCSGRIMQLDNFRKFKGFGWSGFKKMNLWRQNKGNAECVKVFVKALREGKPPPISFDELLEVTKVSFEVMEKVRSSGCDATFITPIK